VRHDGNGEGDGCLSVNQCYGIGGGLQGFVRAANRAISGDRGASARMRTGEFLWTTLKAPFGVNAKETLGGRLLTRKRCSEDDGCGNKAVPMRWLA